MLDDKFTCRQIIQGLQDMNFYKLKNEGYIPTYVSNDFTDVLHETFHLQTDSQIIPSQEMKKIFKSTKNRETLLKKRG